MNDSIRHLPGIEVKRVCTARLETQVLVRGPEDGQPVLFLHGNFSSSTFWEETMLALPERFRSFAPDQRGYGLSDRAAWIDATRGFGDWADDVTALADSFDWDQFHLVAHSLGGCVAWAVIGSSPQRLRSVTLVAPGPPCGFGGARGERGELIYEDGAGSGAGLVHPELVRRLSRGERTTSDESFSPRTAMNRLCWRPPFRPPRAEELLTAMLQIHLGERRFPGDRIPSPHWPGFAPGRFGPINAMSPRYNSCVLSRLLETRDKPRLLCVLGSDDSVIADNSASDAGTQGKLGLRLDWPGEEVFPPQPVLSEVMYTLDQYERSRGSVRQLVLAQVGHTPYLERPLEFQAALIRHLEA